MSPPLLRLLRLPGFLSDHLRSLSKQRRLRETFFRPPLYVYAVLAVVADSTSCYGMVYCSCFCFRSTFLARWRTLRTRHWWRGRLKTKKERAPDQGGGRDPEKGSPPPPSYVFTRHTHEWEWVREALAISLFHSVSPSKNSLFNMKGGGRRGRKGCPLSPWLSCSSNLQYINRSIYHVVLLYTVGSQVGPLDASDTGNPDGLSLSKEERRQKAPFSFSVWVGAPGLSLLSSFLSLLLAIPPWPPFSPPHLSPYSDSSTARPTIIPTLVVCLPPIQMRPLLDVRVRNVTNSLPYSIGTSLFINNMHNTHMPDQYLFRIASQNSRDYKTNPYGKVLRPACNYAMFCFFLFLE